MKILNVTAAIALVLFLAPFARADFQNDLYISVADVTVPADILVGETVRLYATVHNNSSQDLPGVVKFYDETAGTYIGTDQPISVLAGKTDDVFIDWKGDKTGDHPISVRIFPWNGAGDNPDNNKVVKKIYVDKDSDGDKVGDRVDTDDDNDGAPDAKDALPLDPRESEDTDHDGTGNNADTDDDNDGVADIEDAFPTDAKETVDRDGDKVGDASDTFPDDSSESADSDKDGIGDNADSNDANQGPVILITAPEGSVHVKEIIHFSASGSSDPDGSVSKVEWDFGDGETAEGVETEHVYREPGDYPLKVTLTDDAGEARTQTFTVTAVTAWSMLMWIIPLLLLILLFWLIWDHKRNEKKAAKK